MTSEEPTNTTEDSDVQPKELRERPDTQTPEDLARASDVEEYMRDVIDPELGINVVDRWCLWVLPRSWYSCEK